MKSEIFNAIDRASAHFAETKASELAQDESIAEAIQLKLEAELSQRIGLRLSSLSQNAQCVLARELEKSDYLSRLISDEVRAFISSSIAESPRFKESINNLALRAACANFFSRKINNRQMEQILRYLADAVKQETKAVLKLNIDTLSRLPIEEPELANN
jgi:DNA-binding TFAR19-related protein (PDSD5 family)